MKKKILITYASYGNGHKAAALNIYDYFKNHTQEYDLKIIDVMKYGNLIAKLDNHNFNMNYKYKATHLLYTMSYDISDNDIVTSPYKLMVKLILKKKIKKDILDFNPDIVISTHFFGSIIMGNLKKKFNLNTKIITIVTDYKAHHIWIKNHKMEDAIIVSNEIVKKEVIKYGVPKDKIYPFGIPLSSKFKATTDKEKIKKMYNIKNNLPTILFLGGSFGANFSYNYFKEIAKEKFKINIIFIAGNNQKLKTKCEEFILKENLENITILGFSNNIYDLLNISDLVITKPGGLSITEAMEMKTPMILIPGNGGQEVYNARYIVKNGFGLQIHLAKSLKKTIKKLIDNPSIIKEMHNNLKNIEENKSVEKLFNLVKEME